MCAVGRSPAFLDEAFDEACPNTSVAWVAIQPRPDRFYEGVTREFLCQQHLDLLCRMFPRAVEVDPGLN